MEQEFPKRGPRPREFLEPAVRRVNTDILHPILDAVGVDSDEGAGFFQIYAFFALYPLPMDLNRLFSVRIWMNARVVFFW
jgi:hypothetical protein